MPQFQLVDNDTGRQMVVESDSPPSESEIALLFQNYDAYKVTTAGPKGSEERRRAMAQEVAAQQALSTEDTESQRGRLSSASQSAMRGGGEATGQSVSMLARIGDVLGRGGLMVGPGGAQPFTDPQAVSNVVEMSKQTPLEREQSIQQDPLYQAGQALSTGARLAYQPNPKYKGEFFTDVIPSSAGAMVPTIATAMVGGPVAAGVQYGLTSGQQAAEEAIASGRPETAQAASIATLPIGAVSEFGLGAAANIGKLAKLGATKGALAAAGRAAGGEAIQEGVEQVGQNIVASDVAGYDPNRSPFEGVPQAMAAGALLGGVIGGASAKIAQANTTPDLLAGLSEKWKAIGLARELNALTPAGGIGQPAPLVQGLPPQTQLDLSAQNVPPQFQMVEAQVAQPANLPQVQTIPSPAAVKLGPGFADMTPEQASQLPPVKPGFVRMYHGGIDPTGSLNGDRDASQYYDYAKGYADKSYAPVWYVDVPETSPYMKKSFEEFEGGPKSPWINTTIPAEVWLGAKMVPNSAKPLAAGASSQLAQLEQSRQAQFPAGGAAIQPEQPQSILPQGDLMSRLREARQMDVLRQPSPMSAAALGTGQPTGGPPALNPMTDWLQVYEAQNQVQTPAPLLDEQRVAPQPQAEAEAPQGDQVRQGPATRRVGRRVNLRAPTPKPQKSSQTTIGSNVQAGTEMSVPEKANEPIPGEAPLSRSEPAAAQGVATEGAATPAGAGVAAFSGRKYGKAPFIDIDAYNAIRAKVDEGIASGDVTAKRIDQLERSAETAMGMAAGYAALTQDGKRAAVDGFKRKLYQSAKRWADGGEFVFAVQPVARSMASDIGKSKAERARKLTVSGESSEEGGEETLGAFDRASTQPVLPLVKPKTPIKLQEETVLTLRNLQRQLGATITQFKNVLAAYSNPEMEAELDDAEVGMLEQARPTLARLDKINYSISSLIREPIGRSRALQAVDKWKLETGAVGARIEVVEDPDLTTPDGRPVAAMVETRPGELPLITLNAAHIASEEEVREKLWHEALHPVWGDAGVQAAWAEVLKTLPPAAVQAELARGYSPLEATMEAAINAASVRAANTPVRTAWQRFLDAVWEALSRVFGFDTKPKDFEQLMEGALRSLSRPYNQSPSTQYAEQLTQQDAEYLAAVQRGDMATAQRMVDEAARQAGYRTAPLFHGSKTAGFNSFDPSRQGSQFDSGWLGKGFYFTNSRDVADYYAGMGLGDISKTKSGPWETNARGGGVGKFYTKGNLYLWGQKNQAIRGLVMRGEPIPKDLMDAVVAPSGFKFDPELEGPEMYQKEVMLSQAISDYLKGNGYDGVLSYGGSGYFEVVIYNPSNIKSADPVTYDDAGNPIPLSRRFQPESPDIRYSVANSFAMAKNPAEIQKRLETSSDPESLIAMGKAAASLITPEFQQLVASVEDAAPGTPEAAMRTFLKRAGQIAQTGEAVVEWGKTHETPIPAFRSIGDLPAEWQGVVGNAMTGAHFALGQQVKSIDRAIERTAEELTRVAADFSEADEKRLVAEATKSEAKRLLDGLLRLIEVERGKLGTSSQTLSKEEADAAAMAVSQIKRGKLAVLSKGLETMAREMPIAGFTSNAEGLAWLRSRQQTAPIFGQDAQDAYNALEKALQRQPDLTKRIEQIRALTLDNVDAVREVGQLGKLLGKNKGNTIKNYAKLRADYESAFRQFKSLSDRMDRLSNRMDGLLRAKEALVNLTTSPEYNAKLGDVFGNNKAMLSGLMALVMERGQPTGVIEFYAPSAYNANGGIKPGGKVAVYGEPGFEKADGLIYRIDWKPDFAIERKNVEAITGLVSEITEALYNPESKNALKDPLARASYERVLNYVQKFLVDNRYLTEQQWKDSILLTGLKAGGIGAGLPGLLMQFAGSLYTTRMNAARASGGRGGAQWEEANRAVDAFEKKSENTLRDTRTENAEARRAAIESHGLNPDDPMAIEEWSAHISAVIGSMQNPSQDQLKEGDYVGGLQVTKEDLRSARIQKQFSSGIVSDFNNMATSFAEVVNPEEEIGGILFTRAAEDYGMKTRREFSQWGREFADLWKIATDEDLKAFRAKQANATGDEQVQMVWDARERLADKQIAGPVWSHISETNSEFTSKDSSQLKAAFARIRKDLKAGRTDGLQTVNAIASTIAELTADENGEGGLSQPQAKEALLQAVDRDVSGYLRAVNAFDESGIGGSNLPDAIMSVKAANGALALARGKMVAPTWFYDYGIHDDYKRAAEVANGKRILLMKVYETMTAYRNAVKRKLEDAKREIRENASKMGRDGRPVGLAKAEKEYDRKASAQYKEGGVFATRKMLEATLKLVEGQLSELKNHLAMSSGVAVEQAVAGAARAFLGGLRSVLLSSVNSIINNLTSTTLDTYRTWDTTNRFWLKLGAIAKANGRLLRFVASDMVAALPSSIRRNLTKRQKSALLNIIPSILEGTMGERQVMEEAGLAPSFESYASIYRRIKANPLTFGSTRTPANSAIEKMAAQLYSKMAFAVALGSWVKERSPGYFDSLLNRTIATDSTSFVEWLTPHLLSWARSQPGETVEEKIKSTLESTLTPESIGVTTEGLALIRDYMSGAGSLESLAARALNDNGLEGLSRPNGLSRAEMEAIQFDAGRKYNIRASSTTPDIAKGGAGIKGVASNVLHMFMGWVLQRMGADATQFFKTKGSGWKKELAVAWGAVVLLLVTLMAGALYKIPKDLWRAVTGNPATTPNILQAVDSPEMALRYLASSTAGVFPVGGEIAAELLGGSGISSPLNNNFLDNNPAAGFLASLLATGKRVYQTGDLKYPLVDFTRKNFWPAGVVLNYAMPGDVEARGAARAVRMGAAGMEVRPTGGGVGARETPATPLVRDAVAALYEGDSAAYQKARQKFIAYQIGQGKTQKEAEKRFESSVSGRDPLRSVLGRQPTADEEATILRRLTPGQRRTVTKAQSLFRKPKKVRLGGARKSRRIRLGRRRPARRSVRLRRSGA